MNMNTPEASFALEAVRQAALLVKQVQSEMVTKTLTKDDRSPVTVADFVSQAVVSRMLAQAFPTDPLVGEENAIALRMPEAGETLEQVTRFVGYQAEDASAEKVCSWIDRGSAEPTQRFWTLDPIDGTKGFLRGDQYAVALALVIAGEVQIAALGCPNLSDAHKLEPGGSGSLVYAVRGEGTWYLPLRESQAPIRLHVSGLNNPAEARLLRSFESGHTNASQIEMFAQALGVEAPPVRLDSQAKYAVMAAGQGDLLLRLLSPSKPDYREKIWDQAAGSLVVQEAGGQISDLQGRPLDFTAGRTLANNRGILASNSVLHPLALQALASIGA